MTDITFSKPANADVSGVHHSLAARKNLEVANEAADILIECLKGEAIFERILIEAAAGAGKSYVLANLVEKALASGYAKTVAVSAFTNNQVRPLAERLGRLLTKDEVCLFVAKGKRTDVPKSISSLVTVAEHPDDFPLNARVVVGTIDKIGSYAMDKYVGQLGLSMSGDTAFDVLFVDEAWQVAQHKFDKVSKFAPLVVGVGDVGQLPPLEVGENPWRGDARYNPFRTWTEDEEFKGPVWSKQLPTVWRPHGNQLALWRAFYPEWSELDCIAEPGDRTITFGNMDSLSASIWTQVATGIPTLLEVDGLPEVDDPDVDIELVKVAEFLIDSLFQSSFSLLRPEVEESGESKPNVTVKDTPGRGNGDPLIAVLATRNQTVDDATAAVQRIQEKHDLGAMDIIASTVDSWQGETNGITVAIHPLSGATELDDFNSAFGRLAVTCTRATHGLLLLARPGIDELLENAPARPGTPLGEPGFRTLPRQTHARILMSFATGRIVWPFQ